MIRYVFLAALALFVPACGPMSITIGDPRDRQLEMAVVEDDGHWSSDRVAIIDVSGLIINAEKPAILAQGENPVSLLHEKLEAARADPRVKAVLLRINSPGGTVTASDMMYREVRRFKERSQKPVIALMMDVAASGGYYLACASDQIIAYPTTVTASIGVIMQTFSVKPALGKIGVEAEAIKSGPNKDVGSPFARMEAGHREILQGMVNDFYARFTDVVRENRPTIPADRFAMVTDGRVLTGVEAAEIGVVDRLGDLYDAFEAAKQAAGLERADLVIFHRPLEYVGSAYARTPASPAVGTQINLAQINIDETFAGSGANFFYLWQPSLSGD